MQGLSLAGRRTSQNALNKSHPLVSMRRGKATKKAATLNEGAFASVL